MIYQFKNLVDKAMIDSSFENHDLTDQYRILGLPAEGGISIDTVASTLGSRISNSLIAEEGAAPLSTFCLRQLERALVYEMVISDTDNSHYLNVANTLWQWAKRERNCVEISKWQPAIEWGLAYMAVSGVGDLVNKDNLKKKYRRDVHTAESVQQLIAWGCEISWQDGCVKVEKGIDDVIDRLEAVIAEIGGINVISGILTGVLKNTYNSKVNRYLFSAAIPVLDLKVEPQRPYGYLLNLAAKQPEYKSHSVGHDIAEKKWRELFTIATHLLKVLDVQSYNQWEHVLRRSYNLIEGLYNTILYEVATTIPQSSPAMEMEMLPVLFSWLPQADFADKAGFSLDHYRVVADAIFKQCADQRGPVVIYASKIHKHLQNQGIPRHIIDYILQSISHQSNEINVGYRLITDSLLLNLTKKPLVQLGPTKFLMYDLSWCSLGFYETLTMLVKKIYDEGRERKQQRTDIHIGKALEQYIFSKLSQHRITYHTGTFRDIDGKEGECDVLIECTKEIILIEIKKSS